MRFRLPSICHRSPGDRDGVEKKNNKKKNKNKKKPSRKSSHQQVKQIQAAVFSARSGRSSPPFSLSLSLSLSLPLTVGEAASELLLHSHAFFSPLPLQLLLNKTPVPLLSSPLVDCKTTLPPSSSPPPSPDCGERGERESHAEREREREKGREEERGVVLSAPRNSSAASLRGD